MRYKSNFFKKLLLKPFNIAIFGHPQRFTFSAELLNPGHAPHRYLFPRSAQGQGDKAEKGTAIGEERGGEGGGESSQVAQFGELEDAEQV